MAAQLATRAFIACTEQQRRRRRAPAMLFREEYSPPGFEEKEGREGERVPSAQAGFGGLARAHRPQRGAFSVSYHTSSW